MTVLINFKICDNDEECGGIAICPTNALFWDKTNKTITINNSKCNSCGLCVSKCPVSAINVAKSDKEYNTLKQEIEDDPRKRSDLFIDRYGAQPIHEGFLLTQDEFQNKVNNLKGEFIVELFNDESIECLLRSIPIKKLVLDVEYLKVNLTDNILLEKYDIKKLPALIYLVDGKLIGKIEGYFDNTKQQELLEKLDLLKN